MRRALAAAAAIACAACNSAPPSIAIALRVPAGDSPLALADGVTLSLRAADGSVRAVRSVPSTASSIALDGVPPGAGYVAELDATLGPDVVARGRSCRFDLAAGQPPPTVSIYFARVGAFAATAGPSVARTGAAAFAAGNLALVAGGAASGTPLASSEQYDPARGTFASGPALVAARAGAQAATLPDGATLVFGGAASGAPGVDVFADGKFAPSPSAFPPELADEASVALGDGRVLVAGGRTEAASPTAGTIVLSSDGALAEAGGPLVDARRRHTLTLAAESRAPLAFAAGGLGAAGPLASIETFDPATMSFAQSGAQLATPRYDHTATLLPDGRVLIAGGLDAAGRPLASAEIFDPIKRAVTSAGELKLARAQHTATLLPSGRVLIAGGVDASGGATAQAEIFDATLGPEGDFVPTAPMTAARAGHAVVALCDGTLLFVGGGAGAELYNPAP
ncbi:MAG TPA: kelch repeat-containing protein [Polyangia bacterium]|nr:kelch repeat-containing protein [Polyangia bacterium]